MGSGKFVAFAIILALLFAGCTGQANPQAPPQANQSSQPSVGGQPAPPSNVSPTEAWPNYHKIGVSFDYPPGMNISEELSGYPGYATVVAQGRNVSEGALVFGFINASGVSSLPADPAAAAADTLKADGESADDISGQAQVRGAIASGLSPNGIPMAERTFELTKTSSTGNNVTAYGYALEFYDPGLKASYPVRIFSSDANRARQMRDRFVSSFRTGQ